MAFSSCEFCCKTYHAKAGKDRLERSCRDLECLAKYLNVEAAGNETSRILCDHCGDLLRSFNLIHQELQSCELRLRQVLGKLSNRLQSAEETWRFQQSGEFGHWRHKLVSRCRIKLQTTCSNLELKPCHSKSSRVEDESDPVPRVDNTSSPPDVEDEEVEECSPVPEYDVSCDEEESSPVKRWKSDDKEEPNGSLSINWDTEDEKLSTGLVDTKDIVLEQPVDEDCTESSNVTDDDYEDEKVDDGGQQSEEESEMEILERSISPSIKEEVTSSDEEEIKTNGRRKQSFHRCSECERSFSSSRQLMKHMRVHQGLKDDHCEQESWSNFRRRMEMKRSRSSSGFTNYEGISTEAEALERFVSSTSKKPRFTCPIENCKGWFILKAEEERHSKLHGSWTCYFKGCEFATDFAPDLALHEVSLHATTEAKSGLPFQCTRCDFSAKEKYQVVAHLVRLHLGIQLPPLKCPVCDNPLKTELDFPKNLRVNLVNHFKNVHDVSKIKPEEIHQCDKCPAYFSALKYLRRHKTAKHLEISIPKINNCSICGQVFHNLTAVRTHKIDKHKLDPVKDFELECPNVACQMRCHTQQELDHHVQFIHRNKLEEDTTELCSHCGKSFPGKTSFLFHIRKVHNPNMENQSFVCEQCGKECTTKHGFEMHLLTHSGPESWKYSCDHCGKKCISKTRLTEHLRTHTKEKPFVCNVCGQKYTDRRNWRNHVVSKHPEVGKQLALKPTPKQKRINT